MMIPGLAYSGYKYEHDKNQPAAKCVQRAEHAEQQQGDGLAASKRFPIAKSNSGFGRRLCPS